MADQHPAWDQIEPSARIGAKGALPMLYRPGEHEIELSKAISLKRLADAIAGDPHNSGIFHARHDLANGANQR